MTAHVVLPRAAIETVVPAPRPLTFCGAPAFVRVLLPTWPLPFAPQQRTAPFVSRAQEWLSPLATCTAAEFCASALVTKRRSARAANKTEWRMVGPWGSRYRCYARAA